jgi:hypothetical protein
MAAGIVPSAAAPSHVETGTISSPTFGSPAIPRLVSYATGTNGAFGWVFALKPGMKRFSLAAEVAPTGLEDFDIFFYASIDPVAEPVAPAYANQGPVVDEAIPADAAYAVVTLATGAQGTFRYTAW